MQCPSSRQGLAHRRRPFHLAVTVIVGLLGLGPAAFAAVELAGSLNEDIYPLHTPYGAAVDAIGDVYVADTNNHRIVKFRREHNFYASGWFGGFGSGPGQLSYPHAVAAAEEGRLVFVADSGNSRVAVFDKSGNFVRQFGT